MLLFHRILVSRNRNLR